MARGEDECDPATGAMLAAWGWAVVFLTFAGGVVYYIVVEIRGAVPEADADKQAARPADDGHGTFQGDAGPGRQVRWMGNVCVLTVSKTLFVFENGFYTETQKQARS